MTTHDDIRMSGGLQDERHEGKPVRRCDDCGDELRTGIEQAQGWCYSCNKLRAG